MSSQNYSTIGLLILLNQAILASTGRVLNLSGFVSNVDRENKAWRRFDSATSLVKMPSKPTLTNSRPQGSCMREMRLLARNLPHLSSRELSVPMAHPLIKTQKLEI